MSFDLSINLSVKYCQLMVIIANILLIRLLFAICLKSHLLHKTRPTLL